MEERKENKKISKEKVLYTAKECTYIAVFVAMLIGSQFALSALPGVELVTVLFVAFSYTFGIKRGMISATVFTLLRQFIFGFYPSVFLTYIIYFNGLTAWFGFLGKTIKRTFKNLVIIVLFACVFTAIFSLLDCVITPLFYAFTWDAFVGYFAGSIPFMISGVICNAITNAVLFYPLHRAFLLVKKI